jgi:hypothetical protein
MGAVFIVIAIWGLLSGTNVLIFHVNPAHNAVHLITGIVALACGFRGERASWTFAVVFGIVYALVALLGFGGAEPIVSLLHLNGPDNWLHLGIAVMFLGAAVYSTVKYGEPSRHVVQHR